MWPDARIKSGLIFTKVAQKCSKSRFYIKREVFKIAQKVAQNLGYFCKEYVSKTFQKEPNLVTLVIALDTQSQACKETKSYEGGMKVTVDGLVIGCNSC